MVAAIDSRPRGVAVNMPPCHGGDRRFESDRGRQLRLDTGRWSQPAARLLPFHRIPTFPTLCALLRFCYRLPAACKARATAQAIDCAARGDNMNAQAATTDPRYTTALSRCRTCKATAYVMTDEYTCREVCPQCGRKALVGWSSAQPMLIHPIGAQAALLRKSAPSPSGGQVSI